MIDRPAFYRERGPPRVRGRARHPTRWGRSPPPIWVHLPEPLRSDECVARAKQRGVLIAGAEAFTVGRDVPHAVRVSIAAVPHREDLRRGLAIVAEILDGASDPVAQIL